MILQMDGAGLWAWVSFRLMFYFQIRWKSGFQFNHIKIRHRFLMSYQPEKAIISARMRTEITSISRPDQEKTTYKTRPDRGFERKQPTELDADKFVTNVNLVNYPDIFQDGLFPPYQIIFQCSTTKNTTKKRRSRNIIVEDNRGRSHLEWGVTLCSSLRHKHELKLQPV